ncbi:MAG: hypothetical protein JXA71_18915, partial [Chitinispirillaceae bacterium]|nr:hypothetical protein [Chitinispirillaceae bacterium]
PGTYTVGLKVTDNHGKSGVSDPATVTVIALPDPISNLTARAKDTKIQLTWSPASGASCYNVYRKAGAGSYQLLAACVNTTYCTYLDEGLTYGVTYCYKVTSVASGFESAASNETCAVPTRRTR